MYQSADFGRVSMTRRKAGNPTADLATNLPEGLPEGDLSQDAWGLTVQNMGYQRFEPITKTLLAAHSVTVIPCNSAKQLALVVRQLQQLNGLSNNLVFEGA